MQLAPWGGASNDLDYRLDNDGRLAGLLLGRSADGKAVQEVIVVKPEEVNGGALIMEGGLIYEYEGAVNREPCGRGLGPFETLVAGYIAASRL